MEAVYHPGQQLQLTATLPGHWDHMRLVDPAGAVLVQLPLPSNLPGGNQPIDALALAAKKLASQKIQQLTCACPGLSLPDIQAALLLAEGDVSDAVEVCRNFYLHKDSDSPVSMWRALYDCSEGGSNSSCASSLMGAQQAAVLAAEVNEVLDLVKNTGGTHVLSQVVRLERVQSPLLWQRFEFKRQEMICITGSADVNERKLFHGTSNQTASLIVQEGFDFRLTTSHSHGRGIYFTDRCSTAFNYCQHKQGSNSPEYKMLLARVLLGKQCAGASNLQRPPVGYHSVHGGHFSVVAAAAGPGVQQQHPYCHVIFDNHQAYPEYVMTLKGQ